MNLETLQVTYYSMAIVFMTLFLLAIITLIILAFYIWVKVSKLQAQVEVTLDEFRRNPSEKAAEIALNIGAGVASAGAKKVQEMMDKNKRKRIEK
jgi:uncharacterized membrane protein